VENRNWHHYFASIALFSGSLSEIGQFGGEYWKPLVLTRFAVLIVFS
jgi:hypothetical protein